MSCRYFLGSTLTSEVRARVERIPVDREVDGEIGSRAQKNSFLNKVTVGLPASDSVEALTNTFSGSVEPFLDPSRIPKNAQKRKYLRINSDS